jgi:colanic acid/amylovoran biosynthesis glycosyltransferase
MKVACYCHDFLKADMQHVYRQIVSLRTWKPKVICQKRENETLFPFSVSDTAVLPKPAWRWARRNYFKYIKRTPLMVTTGRVIELLKEVYRHDAAVVHVYFGHIALQLLPFLKACPKPIVVSFHGADVGVDVTKPAFHEALREVFNCATLILGRSHSLLEGLEKLGCPPEKLRLQRTGIPLHEWSFQEREWPQDGRWHWLQTCRLVPKKGLRTTLQAFREVRETFPLAKLTLAGDGPMRAELEALVKQWNLQEAVHFPGFLKQSELQQLASQAHLFVHPSETPADGNQEGVPNAMLEAMASGLPVLATTHGGIPEAVTDQSSGFLVAERDAAALARAALALMQDESKYRAMAKAASREVAEKFERSRQTAILESFYSEAAGLVPEPV